MNHEQHETTHILRLDNRRYGKIGTDTEGAKRPRPTEQLKRPKAENEVYLDPVFYLDGQSHPLGQNYQSWESMFSFFWNHPLSCRTIANLAWWFPILFSYFGWWSILVDMFQMGWNYHLRILRIIRRALEGHVWLDDAKKICGCFATQKLNGFVLS